MTARNRAIVGWTSAAAGIVGALTVIGSFGDTHSADAPSAGVRATAAVIGVLLLLIAVRTARAGVAVGADAVVVRSVFWSRRLPGPEVAGLAVQAVLRRRRARLVVVSRAGEFIPASFATWPMPGAALQQAATQTASALAGVAGPGLTAAEVSEQAGRTEHPAAFTTMAPDGDLIAVPAVVRAPGVTPDTVPPVANPASRTLLRAETVAVTLAFVLPAASAAIAIFARHVDRVSNLDEFSLPLPDNPVASLVLMVLLYLATAVVTPIALILLARTGTWPRNLGLRGKPLLRDIGPGIGLLLGVFVTEFALIAPLSPLLRHHGTLTNASHDTHVPAYFVIYALVVSLTTAINEEVVVNGYLITRLGQLGWTPWPSLALSLTLRTSYHAYYGLAIIGTIPFGYWATRSFQRHGRLGRPIVAHFVNDAVLLTIAVLRS